MSFLEFYNTVQESMEDFYVGKIRVRLVEVTDETYNLSEANERIPGNMATLGQAATPNALEKMLNVQTGKPVAGKSPTMPGDTGGTQFKKYRATYSMNGHDITNYLTAMNKNEAKRMLFDYLEKLGNEKQRAAVVNSSEIVPVDNWNELIKLLQYSMKWDRKKKGTSTSPFQSLDNADFHMMLTLVNKHPDFVKSHLAQLPQDLQWYFKKAYNGLSKRDLDKDLNNSPQGSYWGNQVKNLVGSFGKDIGKKLAAVKTRNSPGANAVSQEEPVAPTPEPEVTPTPMPSQNQYPSIFPHDNNQGTLGTGEENPYRPIVPGMRPQPEPEARPRYQGRLPFWR